MILIIKPPNGREKELPYGNSWVSYSVENIVKSNEFPLRLACECIEFQNGEYGCIIGKVVNVTADESVMVGDKIDIPFVNSIAFDPYTHERVGEAFKDGLRLKKQCPIKRSLRNERPFLIPANLQGNCAAEFFAAA